MALRHLGLRDFVIVAELELDLQAGFTALTGETGAGKSILIDALQLVLGGRGDALWVRQGQPRCEINAEFDSPDTLAPWLHEHGFDSSEPGLLLRRNIDAGGKSRAWINGSPATLTQLRELGQSLVDIHGQHAWQSLTRPAAVRALLDGYAGLDSTPLLASWQHWQQALQALEQARTAQHSQAQERERLLWQISELERLSPAPDEWHELNQQHTRLAHAQALIDAAHQAAAALQDDAQGSADALAALARAQQLLQNQRHIEPGFAPLIEVLQTCEAQARDVLHSLHAYGRHTELDPQAFAALDERLGQWLSQARRWHRVPEELPELLTEWKAELGRLEAASDLEQLRVQAEQAEADWRKLARQATTLRAQAAPRLAQAVSAVMQELGMEGGQFEVQLAPLAEPAAYGLENTHFLMTAHAGASPRPIERVASGGELSRLALAIAVTTSALGEADTLVFDEVDAGVGGAVAATVGRLLQRLGHSRQVLCVTHLPQVAASANQHLHVSKSSVADGDTQSRVSPIAGDARVHEIARMLGGERLSDTSLAHARELIEQHPSTPQPTLPKPRRPRSSGARQSTAT